MLAIKDSLICLALQTMGTIWSRRMYCSRT